MNGSNNQSATAVAHPNIALVKYWGKRSTASNLPAVGSLSVTLDTLQTRTSVTFDTSADADSLLLDGSPASAAITARISRFLDLLRARAGMSGRARVESHNNFPTGAGLASSASAFAALAVAADAALGLNLPPRELSILARQGSGSAARSIFGGFALMHRGERADGEDCYAEPLLDGAAWPLAVVVGITSLAAKEIGSTEGMERSRLTAPYYDSWIKASPADLKAAQAAIDARDFMALAQVAEHSCLTMHALAMASQPPLLYWNAATMAGIHAVQGLRQRGVPVFFTIDAGPQIKAICLADAAPQVVAALRAVQGVQRVVQTGMGPGAHVIESSRAAA